VVKVLVTGSAGFIGGYVVQQLLDGGHTVVGLDNFSKYGPVKHSYDDHPSYQFVEGDARDVGLVTELLDGCDHFIAGAAMIGGISYFHAYAYDLLATNERIMAASCDAALAAHRAGTLKKMTYVSSSMVYESTDHWPSAEGDERKIPPPLSSYGLQKLAVEYYARAAWDQYRLPYTIVRPFKGQDPLHILGQGNQVRHYTYGGDLARGVVATLEHPAAVNEDFNLSTAESTTVAELAGLIWRKIKGPAVPLRLTCDDPYEYDVQKRVPDVAKAKAVLGYEATTTLGQMLDEVIPWIEQAVREGRL